MFENSYTFSKCNKTQALNKTYLYETVLYRFSTPVDRYTVELEHYHYSIFVIKFYRTKDRKNKNKFNIITNEFNCTRIISTCIKILSSVLEQKPLASFGFIGSYTISDNYTEEKNCTQRFRIYKMVMENLIGETLFHHSMDLIHSTYLMVNNGNKSPEEVVAKARTMFEKVYPGLDTNLSMVR